MTTRASKKQVLADAIQNEATRLRYAMTGFKGPTLTGFLASRKATVRSERGRFLALEYDADYLPPGVTELYVTTDDGGMIYGRAGKLAMGLPLEPDIVAAIVAFGESNAQAVAKARRRNWENRRRGHEIARRCMSDPAFKARFLAYFEAKNKAARAAG